MKDVKRMSAFLGGCLALTSAAAASSAGLPWETWTDLRSVAMVGGDSGNYLASSYCLDGCRYDRSSVDPGKGSQRFIRIEPTADGDQGVIFEQPGAGAVPRIWMTTGDGVSPPLPSDVRIRIYFDGNPVATIDEPPDRFFNPIEYRPFMPPLASDRLVNSGGNVSYVPLTYQHGIKIALLHGADLRLWYQLNYTQVPDGTPVTTFADRWQFSALASLLAQPLTSREHPAVYLPRAVAVLPGPVMGPVPGGPSRRPERARPGEPRSSGRWPEQSINAALRKRGCSGGGASVDRTWFGTRSDR